MNRTSLVLLLAILPPAGCSSANGASPDAGARVDVGTSPDAAASDAPLAADAPPTDAAVDAQSAIDAGACTACVNAALAWRYDGGRACTRDSSALGACRAFTHRRVAEACDPVDLECTNELPACPGAGAVTAVDVESGLAHADVIAALAAAPVLYGTDPRAFDGQIFSLTVDSRVIEVGVCADASCSDIPAGVRALQALLERLTMQQLDAAGCVEVFPGG